jgi:hypothetical protein
MAGMRSDLKYTGALGSHPTNWNMMYVSSSSLMPGRPVGRALYT